MRMHKRLIVSAGLLALVLALGLGCGGGGNGGGQVVTTGISGRVVDATSQLGIGNMRVTVGGTNVGGVIVGGVSALSTTPNGVFVIGAAVGNHQLLSVQNTTLFVPVSDVPMYVDVAAGQVTAIEPLMVIAPELKPPPA